jgi:hypothetical protein
MGDAFSRECRSDFAPYPFRYRVGTRTTDTSAEFGKDLSRLLPPRAMHPDAIKEAGLVLRPIDIKVPTIAVSRLPHGRYSGKYAQTE